MFFVVLCCCLVALCQGITGEGELHIKNASDLITFSKNVNSGTNYSGTTVFLDADIDISGDLSEQFEPIGKSNNYYFQGTFDGQGHTISSLAISSSSGFVGLFGYSKGTTIMNVVLDSSCSVMCSYSSSTNAYFGGIIGDCSGCTIENTVNMASVTFIGNICGLLYLGGIAGYLTTSNNEVTVRNCANYGSVTHSGAVKWNAHIGGIVGLSSGTLSKHIQNCLNYGTITHNGTTTGNLYIGGILGYSFSGTNNIENCVSGGKITSNKGDNYIGSIVGSADSDTTTNITRCYWTSDVGNYNAYGSGNSTIDNETKQINLNTTTVDNLNSHAANRSWNKWLLNTNNKSVTFKVNSGRGFNISSQLILFLPLLRVKTTPSVAGLKMKIVPKISQALLL